MLTLATASPTGKTETKPRTRVDAGKPGDSIPRSAVILDAADGDPADAVFVNSEGDVGIGTTTPQELLDVAGNMRADHLIVEGKATIGPGHANQGHYAFVAGSNNTAIGTYSTIPGGFHSRADGISATISGGESHTASGNFSTISGGSSNVASGDHATVGGGWTNSAEGPGATVAGGSLNVASGDHSFAAGKRAKARHETTFVWADHTFGVFESTAPDQFLIRATGGVGIGTNAPEAMLDVSGTVKAIAFDLNGHPITSWPTGGVPIGGIIMWSGSVEDIPGGWALCDGGNGTPNLRDRFLVGAGNSYSVGDVGGENVHTLTASEMPAHDHTVNFGLGTDGVGIGMDGDTGPQWTTRTGPSGDGQPHENRPPYYALALIMKLSEG